MSIELRELELAGPAAPWTRLGFTVGADGSIQLGTVRLVFTGEGEPGGILRWGLAGVGPDDLDGLPTRAVDASPLPAGAEHPNGALHLDHVVVFTPDLERTFAALEAAGLDLRRVRDTGSSEHPARQGFYRLGEVILEVVGDVEPAGPARFWGLVVIVSDIDALAARLGDDLGTPREAVQPGRRIATLRGTAGLGIPVAFMTPDLK